MAKVIQSTPSFGSMAGILTAVLLTAVSLFILSQFEVGRKLTGTSKGTLALGNAA